MTLPPIFSLGSEPDSPGFHLFPAYFTHFPCAFGVFRHLRPHQKLVLCRPAFHLFHNLFHSFR